MKKVLIFSLMLLLSGVFVFNVSAQNDFYEIYFALDNYQIRPEAEKQFQNIVNFLKNRDVKSILIHGHTCDIGSDNYNETLSLFRAQSASVYILKRLPYLNDFLEIEYFGKTKPKYNNADENIKWKNRRVEVFIVSSPRPAGAAPISSEPKQEKMKTVYTAVVDEKGDFIEDLKKDDFKIYEKTEEARVVSVSFEKESFPSSVSLLLDKSGSMRLSISELKKAAEKFIQLKKPQDKIWLGAFNGELHILHEFESGSKKLIYSLQKLNAEGTTHLYDALQRAVYHLVKSHKPRLLVLMSDGIDEGSGITLQNSIDYAALNGVTVFTINFGAAKDENVLKRIADSTGGSYYFVKKAEDLKEVYAKISKGVLQSKYKINYMSTDEDAAPKIYPLEGKPVGNL